MDLPKDKPPKDKPTLAELSGPSPKKTLPGPAKIDDAAVEAYLKRHPDFLEKHPDLLKTLTPPELHRGDTVVDMQHFMLQRHRSEIANLKAQQSELVALSRLNLTGQARVHAAVLALLSAHSFEHLIQIVTTDLAVLLDTDVVTIGVETTAAQPVKIPLSGVILLQPGTVEGVLGGDRDVKLVAETEGDPKLFGNGAGLVKSAAYMRVYVSSKAPTGLLSLGSRNEETFHPGQGTELLHFLARTLAIVIAGWLDLTPD